MIRKHEIVNGKLVTTSPAERIESMPDQRWDGATVEVWRAGRLYLVSRIIRGDAVHWNEATSRDEALRMARDLAGIMGDRYC